MRANFVIMLAAAVPADGGADGVRGRKSRKGADGGRVRANGWTHLIHRGRAASAAVVVAALYRVRMYRPTAPGAKSSRMQSEASTGDSTSRTE